MTATVHTAPIEIDSRRLATIPLAQLSERPLVSILTSHYNYANFLPEAAESVLDQSYPHFEWIICDDGSTDGSRDVLESLRRRDSRIQAFTKQNGGQASGLNAAFRRSSGELIFLLDSDDKFHRTKLEMMVSSHQSQASAGFGLHRVRWINNTGSPQGLWPPAAKLPSGWFADFMLSNGGVLPYMPPTSALSLHRSVAEHIFPLPESPELTGVADQVITRLTPLLTPVLSCLAVLAEYRVHGKNSYIRTRTDADTIVREITTCHNLWSAQRDFLSNLFPGAGTRLRPVENSPYLIYLGYILARLSHSADQRIRHRQFVAHLDSERKLMNCFWKYSIHLPVPVFAATVSFLSRPSLLKQLTAYVRGL